MMFYYAVNSNLSIYIEFVRKHFWEALKLRKQKPIINGLSFSVFLQGFI
jgi:hypothetical protein